MKNIFCHEIKPGQTITFNEIYPKTVYVKTTENISNTGISINGGEYNFANHSSAKVVEGVNDFLTHKASTGGYEG